MDASCLQPNQPLAFDLPGVAVAQSLDTVPQRDQPAGRVLLADVGSLLAITGRVCRDYARGLVLDALLVGGIVGLGAYVLGVEVWWLLGGFAFLGALAPVVGAWVALALSVLAVLATQPDRALLTVGLLAGVWLLDSIVLSPRLQGAALRFSLPVSLLLLVAGGIIAGPFGAILALPVAALLRDVTRYAADRARGLAPPSALARHAAMQEGRLVARAGQRRA